MLRQLFQLLSRLLTWWVIVAPWERAIRLRFGKKQTELGAGIHLKVPLVHRVFVQNTRLLVIDTPNQTVTTADGRVVTLSAVVGYKIVDICQVFNSVQKPREVVNSLAMGAIAEYITSRGSAECTIPEIEADLTKRLHAENWGLEFGLVKITDFAFVKTYRFITNESANTFWSGNIDLDETAPEAY